MLVPEALGWAPPGLAFDVLLHVASLIALVTYFYSDLASTARGMFSGDRAARSLALLLIVGTIPAGVAGVALSGYFEGTFTDAKSTALQLMITAVILVGAERALARSAGRPRPDRKSKMGRPRRLRTIRDLRWWDAALIGVAQAISILPGISRSGATIAAGVGLSVTRDDSARFAFLLAVPALAGAAVVKVPDLAGTSLGAGPALAGFTASLLFSYLSIAALIRYLRTRTLYPFAAYCVIAGITFYLIV